MYLFGRSPDDLSRPEVLNAIELLQAEIYLSQDASLAMPVFERLWSRRDHPDMIDASGKTLAQAAQLLQVAGHQEFARRMYVAAANTRYLDVLASTSPTYADRHVLTEGLRKMGFEDAAAAVDQLFRISETVHGQEILQDLSRQVDERMRTTECGS